MVRRLFTVLLLLGAFCISSLHGQTFSPATTPATTNLQSVGNDNVVIGTQDINHAAALSSPIQIPITPPRTSLGNRPVRINPVTEEKVETPKDYIKRKYDAAYGPVMHVFSITIHDSVKKLMDKAISWFKENVNNLKMPYDESVIDPYIAHVVSLFRKACHQIPELSINSEEIVIGYSLELTYLLETYADQKRDENFVISTQECTKKANNLLKYYKTVPWYKNFQSKQDFENLIYSLQHPAPPKTTLNAAAADTTVNVNSNDIAPTDVSRPLVQTQLVFCVGPGVNSSAVTDLFNLARTEFYYGVRVRQFIGFIISAVGYIFSVKAGTQIKTLFNAYNNLPLQQAATLYSQDISSYIYGSLAFLLYLVFRLAADGVFFLPLHIGATIVLIVATILGLRVKWRIAYSQRTKEMTEMEKNMP